jgi:hypothetical protein
VHTKTEVPLKNFGALNGVFEMESNTVADRASGLSYKFTNLTGSKDFTLKVGGTAIKPIVKGETPDFPAGYASADAEYTREYFSASLGLRSNVQKTLADVGLAFAYDHLSVGTKVTVDATAASPLKEYNFGAQYVRPDYTVTALTEKSRQNLTVSYHHSVSRDHLVGASVTLGLVKPVRTLTFGNEYKIDTNTNAKTYLKVDSSKDAATVGFAAETRLLNPNVLINFAAEYNVSPAAISIGKFGINLSFGDA